MGCHCLLVLLLGEFTDDDAVLRFLVHPPLVDTTVAAMGTKEITVSRTFADRGNNALSYSETPSATLRERVRTVTAG